MVLPDCEAASAVFEQSFRSVACRVLRHASGRPWLVGCWTANDMRAVEAGEVRLAVLGVCGLTPAQLEHRLGGVDDVGGLEADVAGGSGSFHLVGSVAGRVYARGTASGDRRLFHTTVRGVSVAADRARTLAWLAGAQTDMSQVAVRLASLITVPHPLDHASMFHSVHAVPPGQALHIEPDGRAAVRQWWRAPEAELPLPEGAAGLRRALRDAVAARVRSGERWGADLSGGMDSTSLCFLAAEAGADLVALTLKARDPAREDVAYARQAAGRLPAGSVHLVFPTAQLPPYLTGLEEGGEPQDEPLTHRRDLAQQQHLAAAMRAHGADRRLCGQGGDQVVIAPVNHLHDLAPRHPLFVSRRLSGYATKHRWPRAALLPALADRRSYPSWLHSQARALHRGRTPGEGPASLLGWAPAVTMPPWATAQARHTAADLLTRAAAHASPLAGTRAAHFWLYQARQAGRVASVYGHSGLEAEMPFCDDAVIEASLRVRPHETDTPWSYKPLLATAMHGIVPEALLARTTKGSFTAEWVAGLTAHKRQLAHWCDTSLLAAAGLVDPGLLRRAWLSPTTLTARHLVAAEETLALEAWLRDLAAHPVPSHLKEHPHAPTTAR
ncbi:asparagine synthase [Streptomyces eurythermus]|nr:asparagine synthase [Streptomyces eurythermus]